MFVCSKPHDLVIYIFNFCSNYRSAIIANKTNEQVFRRWLRQLSRIAAGRFLSPSVWSGRVVESTAVTPGTGDYISSELPEINSLKAALYIDKRGFRCRIFHFKLTMKMPNFSLAFLLAMVYPAVLLVSVCGLLKWSCGLYSNVVIVWRGMNLPTWVTTSRECA